MRIRVGAEELRFLRLVSRFETLLWLRRMAHNLAARSNPSGLNPELVSNSLSSGHTGSIVVKAEA